jgi:hypothetical protein
LLVFISRILSEELKEAVQFWKIGGRLEETLRGVEVSVDLSPEKIAGSGREKKFRSLLPIFLFQGLRKTGRQKVALYGERHESVGVSFSQVSSTGLSGGA